MKIVPELRFPEFESLGRWNDKPISKLGETVNGLSGKKGADFGSGKPYVQYKQVFDKSYIDFSECGKVDIADDENQNTVQKGDILFTTSSETPNEVGFASVIIKQPEEDTYLNSFCFILRPFDIEEVNPSFSRYLFHSPIYRNSVSTIAQGSTRFNLSKGAFLKLKVPLPKHQEQQKIASCLTSLDELIAAHSDKLQALQDHKIGLMQQLFLQDGQTVPQYRFPEFEKEGDWEIRSVESNIKLMSGIALKSSELSNDNSGTPILRGINITEGQIRHSKEMDKFYLGDTTEIAKYLIMENDIVIGMDGSKVGKNVALISKQDAGAILIQRVARIRAKNSVTEYLYQHFVSLAFRKYVDIVNTSSGIPHISAKQIRDFEIGFPPKIQEQQKIASCLSAVDELITAQAEKIKQLQYHKKGMMQGLFPKNES